MKIFFRVLLPILISTLGTKTVCAQKKLKDVPILTISDFRAPVPRNARFPIYFKYRIYYKIDTVIEKSNNKYQVFVKTKIEPRPEESYWDTERVHMKDVSQMLMHEQGHFYLAYICGSNIEKTMPTFNFTVNWKEEVRKKFFELLSSEDETNIRYDEETAHGLRLKQQTKWNKWMQEELGE